MTQIYILGENSFLSKNFYLYIKKLHHHIFLITHNDIDKLVNIKDDDVIINFCGVNKADTWEKYNEGNHLFLRTIFTKIGDTSPFFIHISSIMVHGFEKKKDEDLNDTRQWFIKSKLLGENFIRANYPKNKLCIVRPTNIYGYNCTPYYNNLLSTLIYEKINKLDKINKINKNCIRNLLSSQNFSIKLYELFKNRSYGNYNIMSNNNINLETLVGYIYNRKPMHIGFIDGECDIINMSNGMITGINVIVKEDIDTEIKKLEENMKIYLELKDTIIDNLLNTLSQSRGDMVEISNLQSKRLYKITLTTHAVRGNHFHYKQTEEFFTNKGMVLYLLSHKETPEIVHLIKSEKNHTLIIPPNIIHTLTNDYTDNIPEIIISSTQEYIPNEIPDTKYVNII